MVTDKGESASGIRKKKPASKQARLKRVLSMSGTVDTSW